MPRSASELSYYFNVIRINYASSGIRIILVLNVIEIIYASFGIRIILNYLCLVRHQNYLITLM